ASQGPLKGAEVVERRDAQGMAVRGLRLHFELSDTLLQVAFEPDGRRIAGLLIRPAAAAEASSSQAPTHAPYVDTAAFRAEAVSSGKAPYMLSGTLTVPATGTPAPAVVLLHGSGPNDRDGTVGGVKPLMDLAEGLSSRGFVVLRYDK